MDRILAVKHFLLLNLGGWSISFFALNWSHLSCLNIFCCLLLETEAFFCFALKWLWHTHFWKGFQGCTQVKLKFDELSLFLCERRASDHKLYTSDNPSTRESKGQIRSTNSFSSQSFFMEICETDQDSFIYCVFTLKTSIGPQANYGQQPKYSGIKGTITFNQFFFIPNLLWKCFEKKLRLDVGSSVWLRKKLG